MDQIKIGAFIARLRKEKGWTQEEWGERLGMTNKTVSRWENGNYMPGVEMLILMGREFGVSLNELLEGRRLDNGEEFRAAADRNLASSLERPYDRFWGWLERRMERYGAFPLVTAALLLLLGACIFGMFQYRQARPADVGLPGTFACEDISCNGQFTWIYFTFDRDGQYYLFDASGGRLEHGDYALDEDVITLDNGETVRWIVIKGRQIYDVAPWGGEQLAYHHVSDIPWFINCSPEDFGE